MKDIVGEIIRKMKGDVEKEKAKYDPIVRRLTDASFIGIYQAVMEERERRLQRLVVENPVVRQMAINQMALSMKVDRDDPEG